ncbi:PEP-CTERM sorting domain-containing protein [Poriferisphaera sp. WC338]|uniref:PEP-CTERM sorting domain-containing protein n=1 Tax=Poriferisphaera sp. WC338 TaxID=3425129 RepID=UPI003D81421C
MIDAREKVFGVISTIVMCTFLSIDTTASADVILFDFGRGDTGISDLRTTGNWNNVHSIQEKADGGTGGIGVRVTDAITDAGVATTVDLNVTDDFSAVNAGGVVAKDVYASTAQRDSFFVTKNNAAQIRLEGLVAGETYDLTFFGSRASGSPPNREFKVDIAGHNAVTLDAANNVKKKVSIDDVLADSNGYIVLDISAVSDFGYFGVLEIEGEFGDVPEPGSLGITGAVLGWLMMRRY